MFIRNSRKRGIYVVKKFDRVKLSNYFVNDFINALAGPHAHDKVIEEFSTRNSYLFTNDAYIDNLYNTDKIFLNSLIKGTNISDEIIDFYKKANTSSDFDLWKALDLQGGHAGGGKVGGFGTN